MPIQFNAGDKITQLNTSRIEKLMTAETKEAALYMGPWDKFKDLFKTGDNKKAAQIEKIYDSITKAPTNDQAPLGMAVRFKNLRDLATDEAKEKFDMAGYALDGTNGEWEYVLLIDDQKIYESPVLQDTPESSFQNFSDYEMFFNGKGVEIPQPAEVNNIETAIQDVLYTLTADLSDSEIPPAATLFKSLEAVYRSVHPVNNNLTTAQEEAILAQRNQAQVFDDYPNAREIALACPANQAERDARTEQIIRGIDNHVQSLSSPQLFSIYEKFRMQPNIAQALTGFAQEDMIIMSSAVLSEDLPLMTRGNFLNEIGQIASDVFAAVQRKLEEDTLANINGDLWKLSDEQTNTMAPVFFQNLSKIYVAQDMHIDTALEMAIAASNT